MVNEDDVYIVHLKLRQCCYALLGECFCFLIKDDVIPYLDVFIL
jgi:hypothetical protein